MQSNTAIRSAHQDKDQLVKYLFHGMLVKLQELKLSNNSPSLFLIYAHDSSHAYVLHADTKIAKQLIIWLHDIGLNLYSDETPFGNCLATNSEISERKVDILKSQLCILPNHEQSVDYIVLCGSELLKRYIQFPDYNNYYIDISNAYHLSDKKNANLIYASLAGAVTKYSQKATFHHILTELILLNLRLNEFNRKSNVIPLLLNGTSQTTLPSFITELHLRIEEIKWRESGIWKEVEVYTNQGLHLGFFKLLERLYEGKKEQGDIIFCCKQYENCIKLLQENKLSPEKIDSMLAEIKQQESHVIRKNTQLFEETFKLGLSSEIRNNLRSNIQQQDNKEDKKAEGTLLFESKRIATVLKDYYKTQDSVPPPLLSIHKQPISNINLSIVATHQERKEEKSPAEKPEKRPLFHNERKQTLDHYEKQFTVNKAIQVEKIFDKDPQAKKEPKHLLILGHPGVGKSTMSQYMAYRWADGKLWQNKFDYLFWIPLRNIRDKYKATELILAEIVYAECFKTKTKVKEKSKADTIAFIASLLQAENSRVLFLLDGYDEIVHLHSNESSLLESFFKQIFMHPVILTSRPYLLYRFQVFDVELENKGFTDKQITAYIANYYQTLTLAQPERGKDLLAFLQKESNLWGIVHVPLNLALVCGVSQALTKHNQTLKQAMTLTELYQKITEQLLKRYLERYKVGENGTVGWSLQQVKGLCDIELMALAYLAFEGLQSTETGLIDPKLLQTDFVNQLTKKYQDDNKTTRPLIFALSEIGFLKNIGDPTHDPIENSHEFIHLTFQEFFAASYLVKGLQVAPLSKRYSDTIRFLQEQKYNTFYAVVFQFISGLLSELPDTKHQTIFWKTLQDQPYDLTEIHHTRLLIQCLEQAKYNKHIPNRDHLKSYLEQWWHFLLFQAPIEDEDYPIIWETFASSSQTLQSAFFINELVSALQHKDYEIRVNASQRLSRYGIGRDNDKVIETCVKIVQDNQKEWGTKRTILIFLSNINLASYLVAPVIKTLIARLQDKDERVRSCAVEALGNLSGGSVVLTEEVIRALIARLQDIAFSVRSEAVEALGYLSGESGVLTEEVIRALLPRLQDESGWVRSSVAEALGNLSGGSVVLTEEAIRALLPRLQDKDGDMRNRAAYALGNLSSGSVVLAEKVIRALLPLLQDEDEDVRSGAAEALDNLSGESVVLTEEVIPTLLTRFQDKDESVRNRAAEALVKLSGENVVLTEEVIRALVSRLQDEAWWVRSSAAEVLGNLSGGRVELTEEVIRALLARLQDESRWVRSSVAGALGNLSGKSTVLTEEVIRALLTRFQDKDESVRNRAAEALVKLSSGENVVLTEEVIRALVSRLQDKDWSVSNCAAEALVRLSGESVVLSEEVIRVFIFRLQDEAWWVRSSAAKALGDLPGRSVVLSEEVIRALLPRLQDEDGDGDVRSSAAEALGKFGLVNSDYIDIIIQAIQKNKSLLTNYDNMTILSPYNLNDIIKKSCVAFPELSVMYATNQQIPIIFNNVNHKPAIFIYDSKKLKHMDLNEAEVSALRSAFVNEIRNRKFPIFRQVESSSSDVLGISSNLPRSVSFGLFAPNSVSTLSISSASSPTSTQSQLPTNMYGS